MDSKYFNKFSEVFAAACCKNGIIPTPKRLKYHLNLVRAEMAYNIVEEELTDEAAYQTAETDWWEMVMADNSMLLREYGIIYDKQKDLLVYGLAYPPSILNVEELRKKFDDAMREPIYQDTDSEKLGG